MNSARPNARSVVMCRWQEQSEPDQWNGHRHWVSMSMHSQSQEWGLKIFCGPQSTVFLTWTSSQTHVHVSLLTWAKPGHLRDWHVHPQDVSSVTITWEWSQTPSLYCTKTVIFLSKNRVNKNITTLRIYFGGGGWFCDCFQGKQHPIYIPLWLWCHLN